MNKSINLITNAKSNTYNLSTLKNDVVIYEDYLTYDEIIEDTSKYSLTITK